MNRLFSGYSLALLLSVVLVGTAYSITDAERDHLKSKLTSGETLSSMEVRQILELHDEGLPLVNDWEIAQLRIFGRIGERPQQPRRHNTTLDEYNYETTDFDWFDISEIGTEHPLTDDGGAPITLPFEFVFYDIGYTTASIASNGYIELGSQATFSTFTNTELPNDNTPNNIICGFWDDLDPDSGRDGQIYSYHDADNDRFIVQWDAVNHFSSTIPPPPLPETFQIILFSNGNIVIQHQTTSETSSCTVGIENADGDEGTQICFDGTGDNCPADNSAIIINQPDGYPNPITDFSAEVSGFEVIMTWLDPTNDTNGNPLTIDNVEVWLGLPDEGTLLATVAGGVQTYTHANAPIGSQTYFVRPIADPYTGPPTSVTVIVGDPSYGEDFEITDGLWESDNPEGWQWGAPTSGPASAHSGNNCWGTILDGDYTGDACFRLTLDPGLAVESEAANIEFWAWWNIEESWDGCNFKVSIDNGQTWDIVEPEGGYPTETNDVNSCNPNETVWSNSSVDWTQIIIPIGQYIGQAPQFQFVLGSDEIVHYPGFYIDDMLIWGLAEPITADISGTITLDGGTGNVEEVLVQTDGLEAPSTNPAANGAYTLTDVLTGERTVWATLTGYEPVQTLVTLTETGLTEVNLTLVREAPVAPTALEGTIDSLTGVVSLTWTASVDPSVDTYYIYRKLETDAEYVNIGNTTVTEYTDDLSVPGVGLYQYSVTAVDLDASSPVESEFAVSVSLLFGQSPPVALIADGNYDDKIVLDWFEPGIQPESELFYDNGTNEIGGLGFWNGTPTFGWMVSKFQTLSGPITITKIKLYITESALDGDVFEIGVFADNGGEPTFEPLGVMQITQQAPFEDWFEWELDEPVTLQDGIAWVGHRQITAFQGVSVGGDQTTPFINETFMYSFDGAAWTSFEPDLFLIPMQRCFAIGAFGAEIELTPSPVEVERWPVTSVGLENGKERFDHRVPESLMIGSADYKFDFHALTNRAANAVAPHAPHFQPIENRGPGHSLDEVDYYIVYRDNIDIAHPTDEHYEDTGLTENIEYSYHITAHHDTGEESGVSNTVTTACNMAPATPTDLTEVPEGEMSARLTWSDPTVNQDGTPLVDLQSIHIFRNDVFVGSVAAGVETYLDTPDEAGTYLWSIAAADEVPNVSLQTPEILGSVGSPSYISDFEFDNGLWESDSGWERGAPTEEDGPDFAYGGENCWGTVMDGEYGNDVCYHLTLDVGLAVESPNATFEFWGWYLIETGYDGCNLKVSSDNGMTWEIVEPISGYPAETNTVNDCNPEEAAWTGYDQGFWEYMIVPIGQYAGEVLQYQFVFGSDGSVTYPGFFIDEMKIWGLQEPVTTTVTGEITLDGGAGNVQQVLVRADGFGIPETNPAADSSFSLEGVLVGDRNIFASLNGYETGSTELTVTEAGPNVANVTLVRSDPPPVTGLSGSVSNATGELALDWDDSADPLVDQYYIYARIHDTIEWTHAATASVSDIVYQLPTNGIWEITVSALDIDVSTPVESVTAPFITVLYGTLPPTGLSANGSFDDRILLSWLEPGNDFGQQLTYDDGTAEAFLTLNNTNDFEDRLAVRFTPPPANEIVYPIEITTCAAFLENETGIAEISLCPVQESNEFPDVFNPLASWKNVSAEESPGWLTAESDGGILLDEPQDFWVVVLLEEGEQGPGVGGDATAANGRSFFSEFTWDWQQDVAYGYLMRAWIRGGAALNSGSGDEYLLSNGETDGYRVEQIQRVSLKQTTTASSKKNSKATSKLSDMKPADKASALDHNPKKNSKKTSASAKTTPSRVEFDSGNSESPFVRAPKLVMQSRRPRDNSLDDIDYYIVYRDGEDIGHPTETMFEDIGLVENVTHTYQVTSYYDDGSESTPTNTASAACNMAPAAPTGLNGTPLGTTQMVLSWNNPISNQDGSAINDLTTIRIYRGETLIGTADSEHTSFTDSPPSNDQPYTWTVVALDEIPNESVASEPFTGYVVSPWEEVDYEWIDITGIGVSSGITGDDSNGGPFELGFSFEYFGQTYSSIYACTNGWASFTSQATEYTNTDIPDTLEPNCALYPYWDDLAILEAGEILYYADTENDRFILTWNAVPHLNGSAANTFQIVISERGGIQFNYNVLDLEEVPGFTVGVENEDGSDAVRLCFDGDGSWCATEQSSVAFWGSPSGEVRGQIREFGSNLPIENVAIWSVGHLDTAFTTDDGFYSLPVDTGMHTIAMHLQGYCDHEYEEVHIEDGQSYVQNASMLWPSAGFSATSLNMLTSPGHNTSADFDIMNEGAGCPLSYSISGDQDWINFSVTEGEVEVNATQTVTVTADVSQIGPGEFNANIEIVHNDVGSPYTIPVNLIVGLDDNPLEIPTEFAFYQNYPNPFNATTAFRIDLPLESHVELVIFNVMGQLVDRPVAANYPAGRHTVMYTAEALPSGMYIVRMNAGDFTGMQKIVLLK